MHNLCIIEIYETRAILLLRMVSVLSSLRQPSKKVILGKVVRYSFSRSFKVTNQKPIYDFLLVFHCNNVPIFYCF